MQGTGGQFRVELHRVAGSNRVLKLNSCGSLGCAD